jgi:hypothetical protein
MNAKFELRRTDRCDKFRQQIKCLTNEELMTLSLLKRRRTSHLLEEMSVLQETIQEKMMRDDRRSAE